MIALAIVAAAKLRIHADGGVVLTPLRAVWDFNTPNGLDWLPTGPYADQLLISDYYAHGSPFNFEHVVRATGPKAQWGGQAGWLAGWLAGTTKSTFRV